MQQGVQTDATCNIQQCLELTTNNVASVCTQPKTIKIINKRRNHLEIDTLDKSKQAKQKASSKDKYYLEVVNQLRRNVFNLELKTEIYRSSTDLEPENDLGP